MAIRKAGFEGVVRITREGGVAISEIRQWDANRRRPDLVVLDLHLPQVNGLEILKHLRSHPVLGSSPIVVLSGSDAPSDQSASIERGAAAYVRKPSRLDELDELGAKVVSFLQR